MARPKKQPSPIKVVFDIESLSNPKSAPEPVFPQKRTYWHYHKESGKLAVRFGTEIYLVDEVEMINMNTWTATHSIPPLRKLCACNATRIYVKGNKAILS